MKGGGTEHAQAEKALVDGEGRSGDVDQDAGSLGDQLSDRITGVHGRGPEGFVIPDVLADGDAELLLVEAVDVLLVAGLEVAGFVEDVVGGKEHFGLLEDDTAIANKGSFIGNGLPCPVVVGIDAAGVTDDGGERHLRGDTIEGVVIPLDEGRTFEEVERKIAANAEFGEDGEVGAKAFGLRGKGEDARGIAFKITHGGIELGESYFHPDRRLG